ncbi:pyridoxamine 5'-phosphate oxidase family protein [Candidatus Altiarchaeota archaeon]
MDTKETIEEYLREKNYFTLATVAEDGRPMTHPLAYASDGNVLYVATSKNSRKIANVLENPDVAVTVFDDTEDWMNMKNLQAQGIGDAVEDKDEAMKAMDLLFTKFPAMEDMPEMPDTCILKVTIKCGTFKDTGKGFENKESFEY